MELVRSVGSVDENLGQVPRLTVYLILFPQNSRFMVSHNQARATVESSSGNGWKKRSDKFEDLHVTGSLK